MAVPAAAPRSARPIATRAQAQEKVQEQYETGTMHTTRSRASHVPDSILGAASVVWRADFFANALSYLAPASAAEHQTGMVFKPMKEGKEQLAQVASAHLTSSSKEDSLARLNFAAESEVGLNEQIK